MRLEPSGKKKRDHVLGCLKRENIELLEKISLGGNNTELGGKIKFEQKFRKQNKSLK